MVYFDERERSGSFDAGSDFREAKNRSDDLSSRLKKVRVQRTESSQGTIVTGSIRLVNA